MGPLNFTFIAVVGLWFVRGGGEGEVSRDNSQLTNALFRDC